MVSIVVGALFVGSQMFLLAHGGKMLFGGVLYALKQRSKGYKPDESVFTDRYTKDGMHIAKDAKDPIGGMLGMLSDEVPELKNFLGKRFDLTKSEAVQLAKMVNPVLSSYAQLKAAQTLKDFDRETRAATQFQEEIEPVIMYLQTFPQDRVR